MQKIMCTGKIHRAVVTEANLHYVGSITIDEALMKAANILEYERVQVVNINNGLRFETYVIKGNYESGVICVNGAASRLVSKGDFVIIIAYGLFTNKELKSFKPRIVQVNSNNMIISLDEAEKHAKIFEHLIE